MKKTFAHVCFFEDFGTYASQVKGCQTSVFGLFILERGVGIDVDDGSLTVVLGVTGVDVIVVGAIFCAVVFSDGAPTWSYDEGDNDVVDVVVVICGVDNEDVVVDVVDDDSDADVVVDDSFEVFITAASVFFFSLSDNSINSLIMLYSACEIAKKRFEWTKGVSIIF